MTAPTFDGSAEIRNSSCYGITKDMLSNPVVKGSQLAGGGELVTTLFSICPEDRTASDLS